MQASRGRRNYLAHVALHQLVGENNECNFFKLEIMKVNFIFIYRKIVHQETRFSIVQLL